MGAQIASLSVIKSYGDGFSSLISKHVDAADDDRHESDFFELLLEVSAHLRDVTERIMKRLVSTVESTPEEWDPDDEASAVLWDMMQQIKRIHEMLDNRLPVYRQRGEYVYSMALVAKKNTAASFEAVKNARTFLLEHDADASGYSEPYESMEDLLAALNAED